MSLMGIAGLILMAVAAALGLAAAWTLRRKTEQFARSQETADEQIQQLARSMRALEMRLAELAKEAPAPQAATMPAPAAQPLGVAGKEAEEVSPDVLVILAAAVTVFLGKTVRIRSAKRLQSPYEIVNPWAQQGRVFVQASHNLRTR